MAVLSVEAKLALTMARCKIMALDMCRSGNKNKFMASDIGPVPKSVAKESIKQINECDIATNSIVIYSSREGTSSFATARGSHFTNALVPLIGEKGLELSRLGKKLTTDVRVASGDTQIVERADSMELDFYFTP